MDEGQAVRRLERPDGGGVEEDEALFPPRYDTAWPMQSWRAALEKPVEALLDAFLGERLEDVVDDAEIECFQAVLGRGRCKHEHWRGRLARHRTAPPLRR